jgi:hypothetical protein
MTHQESPVPMPSSSEEAREELNEQALEAATGGVSTAIPLGTLRRSFSESDLARLRNEPHPKSSPIFGNPKSMSPENPNNSPRDVRESVALIGRSRALIIYPENLLDGLMPREA